MLEGKQTKDHSLCKDRMSQFFFFFFQKKSDEYPVIQRTNAFVILLFKRWLNINETCKEKVKEKEG